MEQPSFHTFHVVVDLLSRHAKDDEQIVDVIERIIRERDCKTYDAGRASFAIEEARTVRIMLAAAAESQPNRTLRVSKEALAAVGGNGTKITRLVDLATGDLLFRAVFK